jgi:hypothetical protein
MYSTKKVDGVADRRCSTTESTQKARAAMDETVDENSCISNTPGDSREYLMRMLSCNARKANVVT